MAYLQNDDSKKNASWKLRDVAKGLLRERFIVLNAFGLKQSITINLAFIARN